MVLVMEYAAGGELYDYLSERKVLSENEARRVFRQVATACFYCHKVMPFFACGERCHNYPDFFLFLIEQGELADS